MLGVWGVRPQAEEGEKGVQMSKDRNDGNSPMVWSLATELFHLSQGFQAHLGG